MQTRLKFRYQDKRNAITFPANVIEYDHLGKLDIPEYLEIHQWIGKKDKHLRDIYENDIIEANCKNGSNPDGAIYVIRYSNEGAYYYGDPTSLKQTCFDSISVKHCIPIHNFKDDLLIIGNVLQDKNLQLIKGV